jgi:hypothetical protein
VHTKSIEKNLLIGFLRLRFQKQAFLEREELNSDTEFSTWDLKVQGSFWLFLIIGGFSLFVSLLVQKTSFFTLYREEKVPWRKMHYFFIITINFFFKFNHLNQFNLFINFKQIQVY